MSDQPETRRQRSAHRARPANQPVGVTITRSPFLWGGLLTVAFYAAIPDVPYGQEKLQRYFCSHPLEYALLGLFFIGISILTQRLLQLLRERSALAVNALPEGPWTGEMSDDLAVLEQHLDDAPPRHQQTLLQGRLRDACQYLRGTPSASGLEAHLKHLSEVASDRLHDSYSLLLTINWAVPILGFLGTVIGITLAIANVTPEQLDTSLNSVTGGLAVAFDTTTVAMSFSLVLVFAYDWIKRSEQRVLSAVDDIALHELLPQFAMPANESDPLQQAQADAAKGIDRPDGNARPRTNRLLAGVGRRPPRALVGHAYRTTGATERGAERASGDHAR